MSGKPSESKVRIPMQAGRFYEADPVRLRQSVRNLIDRAPSPSATGDPFALLAPHAGYVYSGSVAGAAYRTVDGRAFDGVLILAPSHHVDFVGGALPSHERFATPLGELKLDLAAVAELLQSPMFELEDQAHDLEHAIEVQLPFLQVALKRVFEIVPVALGRTPREGYGPMAEALGRLLASRRELGQRWLVVASSDTYHGYDAAACEINDRKLMELIRQMDGTQLAEHLRRHEVMACGGSALTLTMILADQFGVREGRSLLRSDSLREGRVPGDYVVGYVAAAFL